MTEKSVSRGIIVTLALGGLASALLFVFFSKSQRDNSEASSQLSATETHQIQQPTVTNSTRSGLSQVASVSSVQMEADENSELKKWQLDAGYIRPPIYEKMTRDQLKQRANSGDRYASQKLGELAWEERGDRETAVAWMKKSAEQGSIAALTQASMMFDADSDVFLARTNRFGDDLQGDRVGAYLWARLAAMRGDPDALFGVAKQAKYLEAKQVTQLEILAAEQYRQLQENYKKRYGRGYVNNYPVGDNLPHSKVLESERY